MRPSVMSAFGKLMSIGSSATNTRPSGAHVTTDGCLILGASAMSSLRQPAIGWGRAEAAEAAVTANKSENVAPTGGKIFNDSSRSQQLLHAQIAMPDGLLVGIVLQPDETVQAPLRRVGPGIDQVAVHPNRISVSAANDFILVPLAGRFGVRGDRRVE